MTKNDLRKRLKHRGEPITNRAIARLFGITEQAVQAWSAKKSIPLVRYYQLREKRPELFS